MTMKQNQQYIFVTERVIHELYILPISSDELDYILACTAYI